MTAPIVFEEATYIPAPGGPGRGKTPTGYEDVIAEIALKKDANGKPVARAFVIEHPARGTENADQNTEIERIENKVKRDLSKTGKANDPRVTVRSVIQPLVNPVNQKPSATKSRVTFWTIPFTERKNDDGKE